MNAVLANTSVTILLSLVFLGSPVAFQALISFFALSLYMSYFITISMFLYHRIASKGVAYGPWHLGRFGIPINILALGFCVLPIVFLPFPLSVPITWRSMTYSGPILGIILLLIALSWMLGAKNQFKGPIVGMNIDSGQGGPIYSREQWLSEDSSS